MNYRPNPERSADWVERSVSRFRQWGSLIPPIQRSIYLSLAKSIPPCRILDAGCGLGVGSNILHQNGHTVTAIDIDGTNIEWIDAAYSGFKSERWDIRERIPFGSFDVALCIEVIEHIEGPERALENLLDVADVLYVSTPNRRSNTLGQFSPKNPLHVKEYTPEEFVQLSPASCDVFDAQLNPVDLLSTKTPLVYRLTR